MLPVGAIASFNILHVNMFEVFQSSSTREAPYIKAPSQREEVSILFTVKAHDSNIQLHNIFSPMESDIVQWNNEPLSIIFQIQTSVTFS